MDLQIKRKENELHVTASTTKGMEEFIEKAILWNKVTEMYPDSNGRIVATFDVSTNGVMKMASVAYLSMVEEAKGEGFPDKNPPMPEDVKKEGAGTTMSQRTEPIQEKLPISFEDEYKTIINPLALKVAAVLTGKGSKVRIRERIAKVEEIVKEGLAKSDLGYYIDRSGQDMVPNGCRHGVAVYRERLKAAYIKIGNDSIFMRHSTDRRRHPVYAVKISRETK